MTFPKQTILIDAHVHLYPRTPLLEALRTAAANFAASSGAASGSGFLLLSESHDNNAFDVLQGWARASLDGLRECSDPEVVVFQSNGWNVFVVAGRQVVCAERIEVLCLGSLAKFDDGRDLETTIASALAQKAIVVLPWGVGKWTGARRAAVNRAANRSGHKSIYLGDIAGRPSLWRDPFLAEKSHGSSPILSGTDPYPLSGAWRQIGSFGTQLELVLDPDRPLSALKAQLDAQLRSSVTFGKRSGPLRLLIDQWRMRRGSEAA